MALVPNVVSAEAFDFSIGGFRRVLISAAGTVPTSGWSTPRLSPRFYITPPADGVWEFEFEADAPAGIVLQVLQPIHANGVFPSPPWLKGVRVRAANNAIDALLISGKTTLEAPTAALSTRLSPGSVIYKREIASYDDSIQPIGFCGGLSVKMKKLRHVLTLTIEGPDEAKIRNCVEQSLTAGLIAAIIAAYVTGGAALPAAISAFIASLESCLGEAFSVRIDDSSYWIEWCT